MLRKYTLFLIIFFISTATAKATQPDTLKLEEVSVSIIPFQESKNKATAGFVTINLPGIDLKQLITNVDLMNLAPGVFMASGGYNTNRLAIRGIGSRTPYNSNRIRAYLDDIPLTSGDGISTIEDIDVNSISSIEIVKGPASAIYGSGLGGIVKMSSRYPLEQGLSLKLENEISSFFTFRNMFSLGFKNDRFSLYAGYSRSSSNGYRLNSEYLRSNIYLNARYFGARTNVSASFSLVDMFARIPSSLSEADYLNNPASAAANWLSVKGFEEYVRGLAGISVESTLGQMLTNRLVLFSKFSDPYERRPFNVLDEQSLSFGFRESLNYKLRKVKILGGLEYYEDLFNWQIYETLEEGQGAIQADNFEKRRYLNTFSYIQWKPRQKLIIDGGLNLNLLRYDLETRYKPDSADHSGSYSYDPTISPRLGLNYKILKRHYVYASLGHGFSAPSLEETLLPEGAINHDLKPETGWNAEIGGRGYMFTGRIKYDLTFYSIYLRNMLVTERISEEIFTGINAGTARNSGVELLCDFFITKPNEDENYELRMTLGLTASTNRFIDFTDEGEVFDGKHLPGIPGQIINSSLIGRAGDFHIHLHYRYTGQQWLNDANTELQGDYHLLNMQLSWKHAFKSLPFDIEVSSGLKNLFNTRYSSMILVNAPSFGGNAPRYYYPGMPRQIYAGIAVHFKH